ncbi:MAG TPA: EAL domain-containing protein [Novimethylophilus sp.]|jgi:diguanylate cyclase (GGDEF)-like protein|uniref:putative bifunctional diguanylate cyclase/phosphodiesterase n=1 Tax=Novimethylophilus sp. TaxID=2137426 RepID=UPI002F404A27
MGHTMTSDGTILVVDDIRQDRMLTVGLLARAGYDRIVEADSIDTARRALQGKSAIDLLLLNTAMAEALAFCRELKLGPFAGRIPIIALTASNDASALEQILAAGADDYLAKPVHQASLIKRIEAALRESRTGKNQLPGYQDALNCVLLNDRLDHALAAAQRSRSKVAVLLIDVAVQTPADGPERDIEEGLLQELAARIKKSLRGWDTFCRQGNRQFTVILTDIGHATDAAYAVARLNASIARPCMVKGQQLVAQPSIGISIYPDDAEDVETLLKYAENAMRSAGDHGGSRNFRFFAAAFNSDVLERLALENALHQAIDKGELMMYYQPQVNAASGRIIGAEALLRWQHPELGLYTPDKFIAVTEDSALIIDISVWMLRQVCRQNATWQKAGLPSMPVALHLAKQQFRQGDLPRLVAEALAEEGLAPKWLELEVSEISITENSEDAIAMLNVFHSIGVNITIDEFGMGFSCLTHFRRFPLQRLRIAHEFVRDICTDSGYREIVHAIISMGKSLHLRVIAKGVETEEQLEILRESGCDEIQGYLFGGPMPVGEFEALLRESLA